MATRFEHIEVAREEAIRLGATFEIKRGTKHYIAVISINGKQRKTSLSVSPSDHRILYKVKRIVRHMIQDMLDNKASAV